jgi:hypothetical protein
MKKRVTLEAKEIAKERRGIFVCTGLIVLSIIVLHALLTLTKLDMPALIAIYAFAAAIPLLCGCLLIIHIELSNGYYLVSKWVDVSAYCFFLGVTGAMVGGVATFWHVSWIAGVVFAATTLLMFLVVIFYFDEGGRGQERDENSR